jgi:mycothiol synthase
MSLPAGYTMRPPRASDGPGIVDMLNEESRALAGIAPADLDWVATPWTAPGADLDRDFAVVETAGGELAGYLCLEADPPHTVVFAIGCVALAHHGRGVGAAIVDEVERRAGHLATLAPAGEGVVLRMGALSDESRVAALLADRGYREVRRFWSMRTVFDGPPQPPAAVPGIAIRTLREGEEGLVYDCLAEAFEDHWGEMVGSKARWLHTHVHERSTFDRSLWFVALDGERVVGALVAERTSEEDPDLGLVAELGVRRAARRRGIGEALLRAAFMAFAERGRRGALLTVDSESLTGATRLYERVGMTARPRFSTWEKPLCEPAPA